jgi:hypothetical protein
LLRQALVNLLMKLIQEMRSPGDVRLTLTHARTTPPGPRPSDRRRDYAQFAAYAPPDSLAAEAWDTFSALTVAQGIISEQGGWLLLHRASRRGPGRRPGFTVYLPLHAS